MIRLTAKVATLLTEEVTDVRRRARADRYHRRPRRRPELEAALKAAGKTYKSRTCEGANAQSSVDAWGEIPAWFGRYLAA